MIIIIKIIIIIIIIIIINIIINIIILIKIIIINIIIIMLKVALWIHSNLFHTGIKGAERTTVIINASVKGEVPP